MTIGTFADRCRGGQPTADRRPPSADRRRPRRLPLPLWIGALIAAGVLAGCAALPAQPSPTLPAPEETTVRQPTPRPATATPTGKAATPVAKSETPIGRTATPAAKATQSGGAPLEQQAQFDLAGRLGLTSGEVEIVSSAKTEMPAGSLGCGPTAASAAPGLIIGDEIVLLAGGKEYVYRSDGRWLLPCLPVPFPGGSEPLAVVGTPAADFKARTMAIANLSAKLGIARSAITVKQVEAVQWPDSGLGCPQPGMMYMQVITPGYRIVLEANGKTYTYHTGRSNVVLCEK